MIVEERETWKELHRRAARELAQRIEAVFGHLLGALSDQDALRAREREGAWTSLEVLEHVALADRYLLVLADKIADKCRSRIARGAGWPATPPRHEHLATIASLRVRWESPPHMLPRGEMALEEIRSALEQQRARMLALLAEMPAGEGTLHRIRMSVLPGREKLELYQMLDFIARHAERHLTQIERNAAGRSPHSTP